MLKTARVMLWAMLCLTGACGHRPDDPSHPVNPHAADAPTAPPAEQNALQPTDEASDAPVMTACFAVTGRVAEIAVQAGERVEAGQYLGRLDLAGAESFREQKMTAFQAAERNLEEAQTAYFDLKQKAEAGAPVQTELARAEETAARMAQQHRQALVELRAAQAESQRGILYAPCPGMVESVRVVPGDEVSASNPVVTIRKP
jgi:multidrug resistance efflux pump